MQIIAKIVEIERILHCTAVVSIVFYLPLFYHNQTHIHSETNWQ